MMNEWMYGKICVANFEVKMYRWIDRCITTLTTGNLRSNLED